MKRATLIWTIVFMLGAIGLLYNAAIRPGGMAKSYVTDVPVSVEHPEVGTKTVAHSPLEHERDRANVHFSFWRTLGVWFAAFLTLSILSFLYGDNPFYKFAEAVFIGVTAAAYMIAGFWEQIVPNVFGALMPWAFRSWALPGVEDKVLWIRLVSLILGVMLLWRLAPKGQWIARWPLAVIIGTMAGARMLVYIQSDMMGVVSSTVMPLVSLDANGSFDIWQSLRNCGVIVGVLVCLFYFLFSVEHKGAAGKTARLGIWVLMITFGASFALTVMGRIALLSERLIFLFDDWLWIIDPTHQRSAATTAGLLWPLGSTLLS